MSLGCLCPTCRRGKWDAIEARLAAAERVVGAAKDLPLNDEDYAEWFAPLIKALAVWDMPR